MTTLTQAQRDALQAVINECAVHGIDIDHADDMTIDTTAATGILFSHVTGDQIAAGHITPAGRVTLHIGDVTWNYSTAGEVQ